MHGLLRCLHSRPRWLSHRRLLWSLGAARQLTAHLLWSARGTESLQTRRWRGLDSNFQYAGAVNLIVTLLWHESQVVIRVEDLSKEEREQILYNHIRLGTQTKKVKRELKPFLPTAARIHFPPRRVERI